MGGCSTRTHFVSTVPTEVYRTLVVGDDTPVLPDIRYSALISVVCATRRPVPPKAYWINLVSLERTAGGDLSAERAQPHDRATGRCLRQLRDPSAKPGSASVSRERGGPDGSVSGRLLGGVRRRPGSVLDQGRPRAHVLAGLRPSLPEPADPQHHLEQRVVRGELPDLPFHRVYRNRPGFGGRDRRGAPGGTGTVYPARGRGRAVPARGDAA